MAQTDNQVKAGVESGSEGDAVATAETESNAASDSEVWTDIESGSEADALSDNECHVHNESEGESGAESEVESEVESESEAPTEVENSTADLAQADATAEAGRRCPPCRCNCRGARIH